MNITVIQDNMKSIEKISNEETGMVFNVQHKETDSMIQVSY